MGTFPNAADQHLVVGEVVSLEASMITGRDRVELIADTQSNGEITGCLPLVADVVALTPGPSRHRRFHRHGLADRGRQSQ